VEVLLDKQAKVEFLQQEEVVALVLLVLEAPLGE
jgi:hypothetical protein